ncbi:MAG TPA: TIGR03086 family metal-binding protein [Microlunatus sp.]|nr:TIGR03086 family metal-binding protein [Microlunatus sp.]
MSVPLDLTHPAEQLSSMVAGVTDDQLDLPTPSDIPVRALLAHVAGLALAFTDAAAKVVGPTTTTPPGSDGDPGLPDDWRTLIPRRLTALAAAWQDPAAWEGETTAGGVTMPATDMAYVVNNELVVHGWDLSVSTDQPYEVAEPNLDASWVMVFNTPDDPDARQGLFGPRLPVSDSAPLMDRVLAGAGRDPYWSPPDH